MANPHHLPQHDRPTNRFSPVDVQLELCRIYFRAARIAPHVADALIRSGTDLLAQLPYSAMDDAETATLERYRLEAGQLLLDRHSKRSELLRLERDLTAFVERAQAAYPRVTYYADRVQVEFQRALGFSRARDLIREVAY